jgi:hypothetical protein
MQVVDKIFFVLQRFTQTEQKFHLKNLHLLNTKTD